MALQKYKGIPGVHYAPEVTPKDRGGRPKTPATPRSPRPSPRLDRAARSAKRKAVARWRAVRDQTLKLRFRFKNRPPTEFAPP